MGRIAFVFSGQGDQYPGMGKDLAEKFGVADGVFRDCDEIRPGTSEQCFYGTDAELKETENTQPCLFAMEMAAARVLTESGITPDAVAGFSLGEVVAATFAGAADFRTGFELVCKRGQLMQQAAEKHETSMMAVLRLEPEKVEAVCSQHREVYPVNYNCPGQISVAGASSRMKAFAADIKAAGGRALPLKVKGAFHSPFMETAAEAFGQELAKADLKTSEIPLYANLTGNIYPESVKGTLSHQIKSPVQWEKTIRNMIADGVDTFIEIGPGQTLTNMIKKIDGDVKVYSVSEIEKIFEEVQPC